MPAGARALSRGELHELCQTSSDRNRRDNVTGVFLYDGVRFLQAIEGEHVTVEATMRRISADDRHADISYSFRDQVDQREFPHWSMQEPFGPHDDVDLFLRKVRDDVAEVRNPHLQAQFIGFARLAATSRSRV